MLLGLHVSIAGSVDKAVDRAKAMRCTTFQIFTRNPRGWSFADLNKGEADEFVKKVRLYNYRATVAHMPYLPNLASPDADLHKKSIDALIAELSRCGQLGIPYLVTHLGSHLGKGLDAGRERVISGCNEALARVSNEVILLLEITAGTKNSVGSSFEDIKFILDGMKQRKRVGVCFDTCHAFAAGYDLRNRQAVDETMMLFDRAIGLSELKVVHINDSKGDLNSHLDRHEHIGMGYIGDEGFEAVLKHRALRNLPFILETPEDQRGNFATNLQKVRHLAGLR